MAETDNDNKRTIMPFGMYYCRFCGKEMKQFELARYRYKGDICLAILNFFECKECGIFLQEIGLHSSEETTKKILLEEYEDVPLREEDMRI